MPSFWRLCVCGMYWRCVTDKPAKVQLARRQQKNESMIARCFQQVGSIVVAARCARNCLGRQLRCARAHAVRNYSVSRRVCACAGKRKRHTSKFLNCNEKLIGNWESFLDYSIASRVLPGRAPPNIFRFQCSAAFLIIFARTNCLQAPSRTPICNSDMQKRTEDYLFPDLSCKAPSPAPFGF